MSGFSTAMSERKQVKEQDLISGRAAAPPRRRRRPVCSGMIGQLDFKSHCLGLKHGSDALDRGAQGAVFKPPYFKTHIRLLKIVTSTPHVSFFSLYRFL
jgi:hypothetical protein